MHPKNISMRDVYVDTMKQNSLDQEIINKKEFLNKQDLFSHDIFKNLNKQVSGRKHMPNLIRAYVKKYVKNILPLAMRNAADEQLPIIVMQGVNDIKDEMMHDNVIYDANNPAIDTHILSEMDSVIPTERLEGGAAEGMDLKHLVEKWAEYYAKDVDELYDIAKKQLEFGTSIEMEHTVNKDIAREIALDHLAEALDYYSYLDNMEKLFPIDNVAVNKQAEPENINLDFIQPVDTATQLPGQMTGCDGTRKHNTLCQHTKPEIVNQEIKPDGAILSISIPEYIQTIASRIKR
jgi:hypothetical protein